MAVKLNIEKAYDRFNWKFIKKCFSNLDFSKKWINWIMECNTIASFSALVNRIPCEPFIPDRGIRQGDLYLFIFLFYASSI